MTYRPSYLHLVRRQRTLYVFLEFGIVGIRRATYLKVNADRLCQIVLSLHLRVHDIAAKYIPYII